MPSNDGKGSTQPVNSTSDIKTATKEEAEEMGFKEKYFKVEATEGRLVFSRSLTSDVGPGAEGEEGRRKWGFQPQWRKIVWRQTWDVRGWKTCPEV